MFLTIQLISLTVLKGRAANSLLGWKMAGKLKSVHLIHDHEMDCWIIRINCLVLKYLFYLTTHTLPWFSIFLFLPLNISKYLSHTFILYLQVYLVRSLSFIFMNLFYSLINDVVLSLFLFFSLSFFLSHFMSFFLSFSLSFSLFLSVFLFFLSSY